MDRLSDSQRNFLRQAMETYHEALPGSPAAEYLVTRGIHGSRADQFKLGYVAEPLSGHEMFRGRLTIPYLRARGPVVSIRYRCITDHDHKGHGKYMTAPGDRPRLYNTQALQQDHRSIAICEGELDAITATLCGIPAVGVPGANSWQRYFREPFLGYRNVFILADGDEPGRVFAHSVAAALPNAKIIPMPLGEDVNSFALQNGAKALMEKVQ